MSAPLAAVLCALVAAPGPPVDDAVRRVLGSDDYQRALPRQGGHAAPPEALGGDSPTDEAEGDPAQDRTSGDDGGANDGARGANAPGRRLRRGAGVRSRRLSPDDPRRRSPTVAPSDAAGLPSGFFDLLAYAGLGVAGLLLVLWGVGRLRRGPALAPPTARPAASDAAAARPPPALDEVDRLAGEGAFADAIHALLLRAFARLQSSLSLRLPPARTSREILGQLPDGFDAREDLRLMVRAVEASHFGGRPVTRGDFAACRQAHDRLLAALPDAPPAP